MSPIEEEILEKRIVLMLLQICDTVIKYDQCVNGVYALSVLLF